MIDNIEYTVINGEPYVPVRSATKMLGLSRQRVHQIIRSGRITSQMHQGLHMIPKADVEAFAQTRAHTLTAS